DGTVRRALIVPRSVRQTHFFRRPDVGALDLAATGLEIVERPQRKVFVEVRLPDERLPVLADEADVTNDIGEVPAAVAVEELPVARVAPRVLDVVAPALLGAVEPGPIVDDPVQLVVVAETLHRAAPADRGG